MCASPPNTAEKIKTSRIKRFIWLNIVFILIILLSLPFVIPRVINSEYVRTKAFELLGRELGQNIMADHISVTLFPRPGFVLRGVHLDTGTPDFLVMETARLFPDIGVFFSKTRRPLTGELAIKQMALQPPPDKDSPAFISTATLKNLAIHFSYTSLQQFSLDIRGGHLDIALKTTPNQKIYARSFEAKIKKSPEKITMNLHPMVFNSPSMVFGMSFYKDPRISSLSFSGDKVLISPLRTITSTLLPENRIAATLFKIIKGGRVPHITVDFQNDAKHFLFDPTKMLIKGELKGGTVTIPATELTATNVTAAVTVEKGLLTTRISEAMVKGSRLKKGNLKVNVLKKHHPFNGKFFLTADLAKLPGVLQSLLPKTPLARELMLIKETKGRAEGTLTLSKAAGNLDVDVHCTDINVSGSYERFPGRTFQLNGKKFTYNKKKITLDEFQGSIGTSRVSRVSGNIELISPHRLELKTAQGLFNARDLLDGFSQCNHLTGLINQKFIRMQSVSVATFGWKASAASPSNPLLSFQGKINLDQLTLKGSLSRSGEKSWYYDAKGKCREGSLYETPQTKGISDISFGFELLPEALSLTNLTATINDMVLMAEKYPFTLIPPTGKTLLKDLHSPMVLTDTRFEFKDRRITLQANTDFPRDISMKMALNYSGDNIIMGSMEIKDPPISKASLTYQPESPLCLKGKLNLETIKKIFSPGTATAKKINLPGSHGPVYIAAGPEQGISLFIDTLNMKELLQATKAGNIKTSDQTPQTRTSGLMPRPVWIHTNTLEYNKFKISPLVLQINPQPTGMDITIKKARLCGLPFSGTIHPEKDRLKVTLETHIKDANLATSSGIIMGKDLPIEGKYDLRANLSSTIKIPEVNNIPGGGWGTSPWGFTTGKPGSKTNPLTNNTGSDPGLETDPDLEKYSQISALIFQCQGPFELCAREGRIFQMTLFSRILSLINVSSLLKGKLPDLVQQGFAYDSMIIKGEMAQGRIHIKKGLINGVDMTLMITGWVDPLEESMDLLIFISPLKSVDSLIQKLPIINTMFQGDLLSIPVTAKGSFHDPVVMALSPMEVTKGILNTFKDILTTPLTLLKKLP